MRNLALIFTMAMFFGIASLANAGDESLGAQIDHMEKLAVEQQVKQEAKWKALEEEVAHVFEHLGHSSGVPVREVEISR